jgi:hypothetical protein
MHKILKISLFSVLLYSINLYAYADSSTPTPTPEITTGNAENTDGSGPITDTGNGKIIEVHKALIPPSWGKVLHYEQLPVATLADGTKENLYEFVLQSEDGIVRTATYHEPVDGDDGYWEVLVWDQP